MFSDTEIGNTYSLTVLLTAITQKKARNGNPYVELFLSDGDSTIIARMFDTTAESLSYCGVKEGIIVDILLKVDTYNDSKSYTCNVISPTSSTVDINSFVPTAPIHLEDAFDYLLEMVRDSQPSEKSPYYESLAVLTEELLEENKEVFMHVAAGKSIHHNVVGGLLYHTVMMVAEATGTCAVYNTLDRELLICGAALHDIGKVKEMTTSALGHTEYTPVGRALGHALLGIMMIQEKFDENVLRFDPGRVELLEHMLASHHGSLDFGAIVTPAIPEAAVLHGIDIMDSRVYIFNAAYRDMKSGDLSSNIYALENSTVFKP